MSDTPKYITEPNLEYFPNHNFYIGLSSQSFIPKNKFDYKVINNYYLDLLDLLKQETVTLKDSHWYIWKYDNNQIASEFPPIFLEKNSEQMERLIISYNVKNEIKNGYSIPLTTDFNQRDDESNQYFFSLNRYFSDDNILNLYDNLIFRFEEEYNSKNRNFSSSELETIMKCMVKVHDKYNFDFKILSLADNAFISRSPIDEDDESYYEDTYQVYPHRLICAWKCIIKGDFTKQDIPQAAKVDNFMSGYTLVSTLADNEYFSSYNSEHVFKANLLEIRLQELGVLPYFEIV